MTTCWDGFSLSVVGVLGSFALGCDSPLFHHVKAGEVTAATTPARIEAGNCPLSFTKTGHCASLVWDRQATSEEEGEFTLRFWNSGQGTANGPFVDPGYTVFVKLWMPSMGHGSSPVTVAPALDSGAVAIPGVFKASRVYFVMPGDWDIVVQLRQGRTVIDEAKLAIDIP